MKLVVISIVNKDNTWEDVSVTPAVGLRATKQRAAVLSLLDEVADFRSAQQLHEALRARGTAVGLTTVYRTVTALAAAGEVDVIRRGDGEAVYRRCGSGDHHHHLVCRRCGAAVEVDGPAMERWTDRIATEHGYRDVAHTLELFGLCPACAVAE
jgi:Fur family ferric uptake transcriptional regulator